MARTPTARSWAMVHFSDADLGDARRTRRLVMVAEAMAKRPGASLPKQLDDWADLKGAYRLLSHDQIDPRDLNAGHRQWTERQCQGRSVILAVQDDTHLGGACDRMQHTTLAVTPQKQLLGILDQRFFQRVQAPSSETRTQRHQRWRESAVWRESMEAIGPTEAKRLIHVADRAGDEMDFLSCCRASSVGFVVRAQHDRRIAEGEPDQKLFDYVRSQPELGRLPVSVSEQRDRRGRIVRRQRQVTLSARSAAVTLLPPWHHPGDHEPTPAQAVFLEEIDPPSDLTEPVRWLLLTSEAADTFESAKQVIGYYQSRWVIEEWHRSLKEGCRVEAAQLDDPEDHLRQAAILSVVAVRLMQWRDLAHRDDDQAHDPSALRRWVPQAWITVVAQLAGCDPRALTPHRFLRTIAGKGGYLGRKHDPLPGWKVLWRGWQEVHLMVEGYRLAHRAPT